MVHKGPVLPTVSNHGRAPTNLLKSENAGFPTEGRKAVTCYSMRSTRRYTESQEFPQCLLAGGSSLPCLRAWNPSSSAEWYSSTLRVLGGLPPTVHRGPVFPTMTARESHSHIKEWEPQILH
jgi:hypothetical protein